MSKLITRWRLLILASLFLAAVIIGGCLPLVPPATPTLSVQATATALPTATPTPLPTATPTPRPLPTATPDSGFTLVLTEAQLNTMVTDAISKNTSLRITNPALDLRPGLLVLSGRTAIGFLTVNFEISASVPVRDGRPQPQVEQVKVNGAVVGGFLRDQVASMVQPYLDSFMQADLGATIQAVTITDIDLRISGQRQ